MATKAKTPATTKKAAANAPKSSFNHVEFIDVNDDGILEEVAVIKKWDDGSLSYIDIATLGNIDKARLLKIVSGQHADKYDLWELLSQATLSNGMNALDFFHQNLVKVRRAEGSTSTSLGNGLKNVKLSNADTGAMIGSEFSDPSQEAQVAEGGVIA